MSLCVLNTVRQASRGGERCPRRNAGIESRTALRMPEPPSETESEPGDTCFTQSSWEYSPKRLAECHRCHKGLGYQNTVCGQEIGEYQKYFSRKCPSWTSEDRNELLMFNSRCEVSALLSSTAMISSIFLYASPLFLSLPSFVTNKISRHPFL